MSKFTQRELAQKIARLYPLWTSMKSRCNPKYAKHYNAYGSKGIKVCNRWLDFANFIEDMLPSYREGLTLDRENNDQGYNPANCRWVTQLEQVRNRRNTLVVLSPEGPRFLSDISRETGVCYGTLKQRYNAGDRWPRIARPVTQEKGKRKSCYLSKKTRANVKRV